MGLLPGRLDSLTARDVMTERLLVLHEHDTVAHAASVFLEQQISGAPVVAAEGRVVGLLSLADIIPVQTTRLREAAERGASPTLQAEWEELSRMLGTRTAMSSAEELVSHYMTRELSVVQEETSLLEVARIMCDHHRHRVLVLDDNQRLRGIVSTLDILAALVQVADEPDL